MPRDRLRVAFLQGFVSRDRDYKASDAVGYGISAADAIAEALPDTGIDVLRVEPPLPPDLEDIERRRLAWILGGYQALLRLPPADYDAVFIFHCFQQFPVELRRIFFDLGIKAPIIGYTHGSHWDPTDVFRFLHYPGMEVADAANFLALDRVLLVSDYFRGVLMKNLGRWQPEVARRVSERLRVVGLPINSAMLDASRTDDKFERPTIVFNHALIPSKDPELFLRMAERTLEKHDAQVIVTRDVEGAEVVRAVDGLARRFPGRLVVGGTLGLEEYFRVLWKADIQVSTARHETFGVATVEAMYARNCCLLPNRHSYPEITGGYTEILYDSSEELFAKVDFYLSDADARRRAADRLHDISLCYTPGKVVPAIAEVIREAVAEVSAPPSR